MEGSTQRRRPTPAHGSSSGLGRSRHHGRAGAALLALLLGVAWLLPFPTIAAPLLAVDPDSGLAGSDTTVVGRGFVDLGRYRIMWDGTTQKLADVQADGNGSFQVEVTIPGGADPGDHIIRACPFIGCPPDKQIDARFEVLAPATPKPTAKPTPKPTARPTRPPGATPKPTPKPTAPPTATPTLPPAATSQPDPAFPAAAVTPAPTPLPVVVVTPAPTPPSGVAASTRPVPRPRRDRCRSHPGHPEPRQFDAAGCGSADVRARPYRRHRSPRARVHARDPRGSAGRRPHRLDLARERADHGAGERRRADGSSTTRSTSGFLRRGSTTTSSCEPSSTATTRPTCGRRSRSGRTTSRPWT